MTIRSLALASVLLVVSGCDFEPYIDVPTPDFVPGIVLGGALIADSTVLVRISTAQNPYGGYAIDDNALFASATVQILREGSVLETLASVRCSNGDGPNGPSPAINCGRYAGSTVIEAGVTYQIRVSATNLPTATATVPVPARPAVTSSTAYGAGRVGGQPAERISLSIQDPAGPTRYYLRALQSVVQYGFAYDDRGVVIDTLYFPATFAAPFTSADPSILTAAIFIPPDGIRHVLFEDRLFDGAVWNGIIDLGSASVVRGEASFGERRLYLFSVDPLAADAAVAREFSLFDGDENPFAEPGNSPTNVVGGYGIIAGAAAVEIVIPLR